MEASGPAGEPGFGALLRRHRLAAGLSQEALAERARVSVEGISALERGFRRTPQRETLELLAGALALSDDQRRTFEAAAAGSPVPRRRGSALAVGPWPSSGAANAPFAPTTFIGREAELAALAAALSQSAVAAVHGLGGVGKSSLAREYAVRNRDQYSVISWLDAESEDGIVEGLLSLGAMFVPGLAQLANRRAAAQQVVDSVLRGFDKPVLLVFDNLEEERYLRAWLPRAGTRVVITSRNAAWGSDIVPLPLGTWPLEVGVEYLQRESRRADLTPADALAIVESLGALPLALAHASASLRGMRMLTPGKYREHISAFLAKAPHGVEYPQSIFATFKTAISQAEQEAAGAAAVLCFAASFAPDEIPDELFRQPTETYAEGLLPIVPDRAAFDLRSVVVDDVRLDEALGTLDRLSLLVFSEDSRTYRVHRLVRLASRDLVTATIRWLECAVTVVNAAFPALEMETQQSQTVAFSKWPQCARLLPHALAAIEALPSDTTFVTSAHLAHRCATYLIERAEYRAAETLYNQALTIQLRTVAESHVDVRASVDALALLYFRQENYEQMEALYLPAVATWERLLGANHSQVAIGLHNLAVAYCKQNRYEEAEQLFQRALAIWESALGADHPNVAQALDSLAEVYCRQKQYEKAETLVVRVLEVRKKALGSRHPAVADGLNNLAELYREQRRYGEAEELCLSALTIYEDALGSHHPRVTIGINMLAEQYRAQGRYDDAGSLYSRALTIREKAFGLDHPEVASSLRNLADLYDEQGHREDALPIYARALAILEKTLGPDHSDAKAVREKLDGEAARG